MKTYISKVQQKLTNTYLDITKKINAIKKLKYERKNAKNTLHNFIERHGSVSQKQPTIQTNISEKDTFINKESIDVMAPIIHSFISLLHLKGLQISPQVLMDGVITKANPSTCLKAAKKFGVSGNIVKKNTLSEISPMLFPCIILLTHERSVVLLSINNDMATIIQPEYGDEPTSIPLHQLEKEYLGYTIFLKIKEQVDSRVSSITLLKTKKWFWDVLIYYWPIYKHVVLASIVINIIGIAGSLYAMNIYDRVVPNNAIDTLWVLTIGVILAYVFDFILRNLRSYFVDLAGQNADIVLSGMLIDKVLRMKFDKKPDSTGVLVNNLREFDSLREFFSSSTLLTIVDLPFLIIFLVLISFIGGMLVFIPILSIPLMIGMGLWTHIKLRRASEKNFQQNMQKNAFLVEMINGLEAIRCSSAENTMQRSWERIVGASALASSQTREYNSLASTFTSSITQLVTVGVIVWGVYNISEGIMTMGGLIACNILIGRAMAPLMQFSSIFGRLQQSQMALNALDILMGIPSETKEDHTHVDFGTLSSSFTVKDISFNYPNSKRKALDHISFKVNPGEHVAIMGHVGSGKSTLGKLIIGLYEPNEGNIYLDNIDIRQMSKIDIRSRVGFMPQETTLFYGSIRDNIALRDPSISDQAILEAADISGVTTFTRNLSAGLGEHIGERGMLLSGGQRQSIALARAVLHDPSILILDEPTSHMDNTTIEHIRNELNIILPSKTLLLITHRFHLLDLVDRIIILESGKIIADAPRDEVLQKFYNIDKERNTTFNNNKKSKKILINSMVSPQVKKVTHGQT